MAALPWRVAIVGSGPSGFYAAEALLQSGLPVEVDMLERLPVPYGLVRHGVAPDHARLKSVTTVFAAIARDERFRFFGHVALGTDVTAEALAAMYHAVIVATGAESDRALGIAGESLAGVHAARDFVGWYNGRPEAADLRFDLSQPSVVVVGQGNVALDVCRILAKPVDALHPTDIASHALDALARSDIREIHLIGRRGPAQARFTPKELRELGTLPGWQVVVDPASLALGAACQAELAEPAAAFAARNLALLHEFAARPRTAQRCIHLHFLRAPVAAVGDTRLQGVWLQAQRLSGPAGAQQALPTDQQLLLPAGLLLRSVGYHGVALPGLPFDAARGVLPNRQGRVLGNDGQPLPGWYAAGWIKRGPSGVIGTNRPDSLETVERFLEDLPALAGPRAGRAALQAWLHARGHCAVGFEGWQAIERAEAENGRAIGKVSEKFVRIDAMLAAATPEALPC